MKLRTIGYESATQGAVIDCLKRADVQVVIDVRAVASSRRAGFSKTILKASLAEVGIDYVHLRALGTPKAGRDAVRHGEVARMHAIYAAHMRSDEAQADLAHAIAIARDDRACLLCFERDHTTCHRDIVAGLIRDRTGQTVHHLVAEAV